MVADVLDGTERCSVTVEVRAAFERFIGIDWSAAAAIGAARCCDRLPSPEAVPQQARSGEGWIAGVPVPG
jgi:hypothetical protein